MGVLNASYSVSQASDDAFNGGRPIPSPAYYDPLTGRPLQQPDPQPVYRYTGNHGDQSSFGYTYSNPRFSLNAQRILRSADLATFPCIKATTV